MKHQKEPIQLVKTQFRISAVDRFQLWYAGKKLGVIGKVSFKKQDGDVVIHIQDYVFYSFRSALRFLQEESRCIVHNSEDDQRMEVI